MAESANLPQEVPASGSTSREIVSAPPAGMEFLAGFARLDVLRQGALMIGLAASVAIGFAVVLWSRGGDYQPVYPNMSGYDVSELVQILDQENVEYRIEPNSGILLVPSKQVADIRIRLAGAGVARRDGLGYELLDQEQGLGTSQLMEASRYKRSLEGELQRTITSFRNVQAARVHIATPEKSVFVRSTNNTTASVFLTMTSGADLSDTQIAAIANLVASSIPELAPENVTIVDQRGNLLTRKDTGNPLELAGEQFAYTQRYEDAMVRRINSILSPIVGRDAFKAEVTADIDFTETEQADESYDPQEQVIRSEQSLAEQRTGASLDAGIPGALTNQPPLDGQAPEVANGAANAGAQTNIPGNSRQQSTRNYELGRTISYTRNDPVILNRLSVAVVLDNRMVADAEAPVAWTAEEVAGITTLVRDAVGYNEDRGDSVSVINSAFSPITMPVMDPLPIWQEAWVLTTARQLAAALLVLILVLGVIRPVLKNLSSISVESRELAQAAASGDFGDMDGSGNIGLSGDGDILLSGPNDSYDKQLNTVKGMVAEDPARVAKIVKQWIMDDA